MTASAAGGSARGSSAGYALGMPSPPRASLAIEPARSIRLSSARSSPRPARFHSTWGNARPISHTTMLTVPAIRNGGSTGRYAHSPRRSRSVSRSNAVTSRSCLPRDSAPWTIRVSNPPSASAHSALRCSASGRWVRSPIGTRPAASAAATWWRRRSVPRLARYAAPAASPPRRYQSTPRP
ncbi:MAG TPA: hypothetical protein VHW23_13595 [Kofleriaceae bacterium]|nr:hypothetical protein [Kofleriaceae bacterium]